MKQYINIVLCCCVFLLSCNDIEDLPVFESPIAQTEIGKMIIQSEVINKIHSETATKPTEGLTEFYMDFLSSKGYLGKIHIYEVDLNTSGLHVAVCTSNNSSSTSSFSTQLLSEQIALVNSETNQVFGAINGGSFASNNSRPYGILVKDGVVIRKVFTATGNNANPVFFAVRKDKKAIMGNAEELDNTIMFSDLQDAVGGKSWLIQDGILKISSSDVSTAKTVVGIIGDSKVIFFVIDSGSFYISNGMLSYDISKILLSMGVDNAILLNEGNPTTFIAKENAGLYVKNFPMNNGIEAKIANGLIIVKK